VTKSRGRAALVRFLWENNEVRKNLAGDWFEPSDCDHPIPPSQSANHHPMIHPDTELRYVNDIIGYGVFATRHIPRGTITWVRDEFDQAFSADQVLDMRDPYKQILGRYGYIDRHGDTVLCWDHARFMNHSCDASCLSAGYDFEVAVRDLVPGDELTDDYGTLNLEASFECACSLPQCRGQIEPEDSGRNADRWDEILRAAFPSIRDVTQPLWPVVLEKDGILIASSDVTRMRSCRFHHVARGAASPANSDNGRPIDGENKGNGPKSTRGLRSVL
jgi:uncharacterized protein